MLDSLQQLCVNGNVFTKQFAVELDPPLPNARRAHDKPYLRRIFLAFAPELDVTNQYVAPAAPPASAHVFIDVVKARATPNPLLSAAPPSPLPLLAAELDESILRYALGRPTFREDPATHVKTLLTTLDASDLQFVATLLQTRLKDVAAPLLPLSVRKVKGT